MKRMKSIHMKEGYWYKTPFTIIHACCRCKLKHTVDFRLKDGKLYSKWKPIKNKQMGG